MTKQNIKIHSKRIYFAGPEDDYENTGYNDINYSDEECALYIPD